MTGDDLRAFRDTRGWTQQEAADYIGLSARTLGIYEKRGAERLPHIVAMACAALAYDLPPYGSR